MHILKSWLGPVEWETMGRVQLTMLDEYSTELLLGLKFKTICPGGGQSTPRWTRVPGWEIWEDEAAFSRKEEEQRIVSRQYTSKHTDFQKPEHNVITEPSFMSSAISCSVLFMIIISEGIWFYVGNSHHFWSNFTKWIKGISGATLKPLGLAFKSKASMYITLLYDMYFTLEFFVLKKYKNLYFAIVSF